MKDAVLYIHGKGGCAAECEHYRPLFAEYEVTGLDYQTFSPWETGAEIHTAVKALKAEHEKVLPDRQQHRRVFQHERRD